MDIVYYHKSCPDGFCAAFIASKRYPEAQLIPLDHGAKFDFTQVEGKDVLMVDFSLRTREENDRIELLTYSFQILDHHKSAQEVLAGASYAVFDMKRSGAGLAWDYLFGKDKPVLDRPHWVNGTTSRRTPILDIPQYEGRPYWVSYVEDRDLWNWALPQSKEVNAFLGTLPLTIEAWNHLDNLTVEKTAELGVGALSQINHYVREAVKQAQTGTLNGFKTAVVNIAYLNCSEVGNELAKTHDVSLSYFERADTMYQFSLRSVGEIDVSSIAKQFGGGGHHNAAGFQLSYQEGRNLVDEILGRKARYSTYDETNGCRVG